MIGLREGGGGLGRREGGERQGRRENKRQAERNGRRVRWTKSGGGGETDKEWD